MSFAREEMGDQLVTCPVGQMKTELHMVSGTVHHGRNFLWFLFKKLQERFIFTGISKLKYQMISDYWMLDYFWI